MATDEGQHKSDKTLKRKPEASIEERFDEIKHKALEKYAKYDFISRVDILDNLRKARQIQNKIAKLEYERDGALHVANMLLLPEQSSEPCKEVDLEVKERDWEGFCAECNEEINSCNGWKCRLCRQAFCYDSSCMDCDCLDKLGNDFPALLNTCLNKNL